MASNISVRFWPGGLTYKTQANKEFLEHLKENLPHKSFYIKGYDFCPYDKNTAFIQFSEIPKAVPKVFGTHLTLGMVTIFSNVKSKPSLRLGDYAIENAGGYVQYGTSARWSEIHVLSANLKPAVELYEAIINQQIAPIQSP